MRRGDFEAASCLLERAWEATQSLRCLLDLSHLLRMERHSDPTSLQVSVPSSATCGVQRQGARTVQAITMNNRATLCREGGDLQGAMAALCSSLQLARMPQVNPLLCLEEGLSHPPSKSACKVALHMCVVLSSLGEHEEACAQGF